MQTAGGQHRVIRGVGDHVGKRLHVHVDAGVARRLGLLGAAQGIAIYPPGNDGPCAEPLVGHDRAVAELRWRQPETALKQPAEEML